MHKISQLNPYKVDSGVIKDECVIEFINRPQTSASPQVEALKLLQQIQEVGF